MRELTILMCLTVLTSVKPKPYCPLGEYFPDEKNCKIFYQCTNWGPQEMKCPAGLIFNPSLSVCDFPLNDSCMRIINTVETVFEVVSTKAQQELVSPLPLEVSTYTAKEERTSTAPLEDFKGSEETQSEGLQDLLTVTAPTASSTNTLKESKTSDVRLGEFTQNSKITAESQRELQNSTPLISPPTEEPNNGTATNGSFAVPLKKTTSNSEAPAKTQQGLFEELNETTTPGSVPTEECITSRVKNGTSITTIEEFPKYLERTDQPQQYRPEESLKITTPRTPAVEESTNIPVKNQTSDVSTERPKNGSKVTAKPQTELSKEPDKITTPGHASEESITRLSKNELYDESFTKKYTDRPTKPQKEISKNPQKITTKTKVSFELSSTIPTKHSSVIEKQEREAPLKTTKSSKQKDEFLFSIANDSKEQREEKSSEDYEDSEPTKQQAQHTDKNYEHNGRKDESGEDDRVAKDSKEKEDQDEFGEDLANCAKHATKAYFTADPDNCKQYIFCAYRKPFYMICRDKKYFNSKTLTCSSNQNVCKRS